MKNKNFVLLTALMLMVTGHLYGLDTIFNNPALNQKLKSFPLQLLAENQEEGLYQVRVQQQSGAQCGWNSFKNALFGAIAVQAYQTGNQQGFVNAAQSIAQQTEQSRCVMQQVDTIAMHARAAHNKSLPADSRARRTGGEDLYPEEIQAVIDKIDIGACGIQFDGLRDIIVLPEAARLEEEIVVGGVAVSVLKQLEQFVAAENVILPVILSLQRTIGTAGSAMTSSGWHWIAAIAVKQAGVIRYVLFDSGNSAQVFSGPGVEFVGVMNTMTSEQLRDAQLQYLSIKLGALTQSVSAQLNLCQKGMAHIVGNKEIPVHSTPVDTQTTIVAAFTTAVQELQQTQYELARILIQNHDQIFNLDEYCAVINGATQQLERLARGVTTLPLISAFAHWLPVPGIVARMQEQTFSLLDLIALEREAHAAGVSCADNLTQTLQAYSILAGNTGRSYVPIFLQRIQ